MTGKPSFWAAVGGCSALCVGFFAGQVQAKDDDWFCLLLGHSEVLTAQNRNCRDQNVWVCNNGAPGNQYMPIRHGRFMDDLNTAAMNVGTIVENDTLVAFIHPGEKAFSPILRFTTANQDWRGLRLRKKDACDDQI